MANEKKNDGSGPLQDPYTGVRVGDYDRVYNTPSPSRESKYDRFGRTRPK